MNFCCISTLYYVHFIHITITSCLVRIQLKSYMLYSMTFYFFFFLMYSMTLHFSTLILTPSTTQKSFIFISNVNFTNIQFFVLSEYSFLISPWRVENLSRF